MSLNDWQSKLFFYFWSKLFRFSHFNFIAIDSWKLFDSNIWFSTFRIFLLFDKRKINIKIWIFNIYFERWVILLWVLILFIDENILLHSVQGVSFGKCLSSMWYDNFEKCFSQYGQNPGPLTNSPTQKIKMIDPSVSNKCILFI